ncbi:polymorphic toxin-type HINT domain-containing protein [Streptomyces antibioticus]|uniref:polymorphic toxin-type HINT domain-containing protein n=1 Tax=Streptomyces antibioticus TaxID=1890 RepID=UPI0037238C2D
MPRPALAATVLGLTLALSASSVQALALDDGNRGRTSRPGVQDDGDPAKGSSAKAKSRPSDPARKAAVKGLDKAVWPRQGGTELKIGATAEAGGLPVKVTEAKPKPKPKPKTKTKTKVKAGTKAKAEAEAAPSVGKVRVDVLDPARAAKLGAGALLGVQRADGEDRAGTVRLTVDYSEFAEGFGGSYGSRLRLVQLPACATIAQPGSKDCPEQPKVLPTVNDVETGTLSADVTAAPASAEGVSTMAGGTASLVAVAAGPSGAQGTYKATALAPSSSWSVATSSGAFNWNYPFRSVPTPGGLTPTVGLGYSSQSADGRTSATNNQGSWIGEGFSYDPGYIERRYKPCSDDGHDNSGEQCWAFENATVMLNGSAGELVKDDTTGKWHMSSDDGSKVERLTGAANGDEGSADDKGEHWKITTSDGTEYWFGLNRLPGWASGNEETNSVWTAPVFGDDSGEPCYNSTFTSAHCKQAWRWSLDYVKDTHGNVMSYFYDRETNFYALNGKTDVNGTSYDRGGWLKRIDYGQRDGQVYAAKAPARIVFNTAERCLPTADFDCAESKRTKANAAKWPDVPVDQECKSGTKCTSPVQTFFTTKRLTSVVTQMRKDATSYSDVDAWLFTHLFTDNGDDSKTLWLTKIEHEGRAGTAAVKLPSVDLFGEQLANRVDAIGDNIAPFHRFRLSMVLSETGAQLDVTYAATDCAKASLPKPGESTKRCYPVKWAPPGYVEPITDWFHKYVVSAVIETDRTGGSDSMVTRYDYQGDAAWRKAKPDGITDAKYLTWGGWQGYGKVKVTSGTSDVQKTRVDYTFMQGMDGDKDPDGGTRSVKVKDSTGAEYTDDEEFTGHQLEAVTYDGTKLISKSIQTPWKHYSATQTRSWGTTRAVIVRGETGRGFNLQSDGSWLETKSTTTYDTSNGTGRVLTVDDLGDVSTAKDDSCTRTTYADNTAKNILSLPARSEAVSVKCSATPDRKSQVLADERTSYDNLAFGAAPTKGDATKTERLTSHNGTTGTYQVTGATTYDAYGRPLTQKDAKQIGTTDETKTVYAETNGLLTKTTVTNALGHATVTDYAPAWGMSKGQTDPNGKRTDLAYDAMGRLTSVWLPDRASTQTPSIKYGYTVRKDKVTSIKTEKIENDGSYGAEYQLYDSMLRARQIQTEGPDGTRMVADTWYDGTGNVRKTNATYNASGAATDELLLVSNGQVGAQSLLEYDGLGRTTAQIFAVSGAEQWRTKTSYDGELTHVDPPVGGVPTTTVTDGQGNVSEVRHYRGASPGVGVPYDATKYTYTGNGQLETVTDAENNVWRYEYDQLGRQKKTVDPDAGTSSTEYDELDRPVVTWDGRDKKTSTVYDRLGRVVSTWQGDAGTGTKLSETRYDKAGWLGQAYAFLSYVSPTEYFGTAVQSMDEFYRPLKTAYQIPVSQGALAGTHVYTSTYNRDGTVQSAGLPAVGDLPAEVLTYTYDGLQRPTTMTGSTSYVTNTVYSGKSLVQQLELSTGSGKKVWQTYTYEKGTDRLTRSVTDVYGATAPAKDSRYSYDQAGNVLSIADTANSASPDAQCFAYDGRQRLKDAWTPAATAATAAGSGTRGSTTPVDGTGPTACDAAAGTGALGGPAPYWKSYETDAIGNRVSEVNHDTGLDASKNITRDYEYGGAGAKGDGPHQVTKITENTPTGDRQSTYEYDDAGNTTKRTIGGNAQNLVWNDRGKLSEATEADGAKTTYLYDSSGNRLVRKDPTGTTVYLPGTELKLSADGTRTEATRYYEFAGQSVAVRTAGKVSFIASDHHGTGEVAIDSATGATSQRRFDPFGVERGAKTGAWPGEKGYVGGTIDASTGLTHLGAREYDAVIGKFISVDPVIDYTQPQQINGYAYANNSPVTHADPSGMIIPECREGLIECRGGMPYIPKTETEKAQSDVDQASRNVTQAEGQQSAAKQRIKSAGKALVKIARDILGVDAALDCISTGDVGACGETLLNIAGSFAGGLAGKILAKYGAPWNWAKGIKLAKRVTGLVGDLIGGAKSLWKANKAVGKARAGFTKAAEKLAAAKKKAAAALKKKKSCEVVHSFLPGTKVLLKGGSAKPIENVKLGDRVVVTDPATGRTTVREVVGTIVTQDDKHFVDLTVKGTGGKDQAITSTTTHPFWVDSLNRWVEAGDLRPGMRLHTASGATAELTSVRPYHKMQRTHDLTIDGIHTYYVLAQSTPLLVHNCDPRPGPAADGTTLEDYAEANRGANQASTPDFVTEYKSPSGKRYYGRTQADHGIEPDSALDDVLGANGRRTCSEVCAMNEAQKAEGGSAVFGGHFRTLRVRPVGSPKPSGTLANPCVESCQTVVRKTMGTYDAAE